MWVKSICCLLLAGCTSALARAQALRAVSCDASSRVAADWPEVIVDPGPAALRLPRRYAARPWMEAPNLNVRAFGHGANVLTIQEVSGPATLDSAGRRREEGSPEHTKCRETINGRPAIVHVFRGPGSFLVDGQSIPAFDIKVAIEIEPGRYLHVGGVSVSPELQRQQLAIARSVRIIVP